MIKPLTEKLICVIIPHPFFNIKHIRLFHHWDFINDDYLIMGVIYLCEVIKGDIKLSCEHDYYEWLPLSEESVPLLTPSLAQPIANLNLRAI